MKSTHDIHWTLPDTVQEDDIKSRLQPCFHVERVVTAPVKYTLFDDANWAIWHSGALYLRRADGRGELHLADKCVLEHNVEANAKFWWDFPEGELRQKLKKRINLRSVTEKSHIEMSYTGYDLLNEDQKTVVRLRFTFCTPEGGGSDTCDLSVTPLRGYLKEFKTVVSLLTPFLDDRGINPHQTAPGLRELFIRLGVQPSAPVSNRFGIAADDRAESAIRKMSLAMVERAHAQTAGILADIDTEFLHEYRVNLRKARSLINLTKQTLPPKTHGFLKTELSQLAGATNTLRDLDVFLLGEANCRALLPDTFAEGLNQLFDLIARERKAAFQKVSHYMQSKSFTDHMGKVVEELSRAPEYRAKMSSQPVIKLARRRILQRYERICRLGIELNGDTSDKDIHALRIECKKIRYLMSFFAELFPKKHVSMLVKRLRRLQSILGHFNDHSVQKQFLQHYADSQQYSTALVAAVNGLIAVLHQKQLVVRQKVEAALSEFANEIVATEFRLLFHNRKFNNKK